MVVAVKGIGKAYQLFQKLKKAGVVKDTAKMGDVKKILQSGKTKPGETSKITSQKMGGKTSQAGSVPTKKKLEFGKGAKGVTVKPSGKKTLTKEYLKKLEIKKNLSKK